MRRRLRKHSLTVALMLLTPLVQAQTFQDPMRPAGAVTAPGVVRRVSSSLKLEGVIAGARRVAIVNGRVVRAGDDIAGVRILEVMTNGVRFSRAGVVQTLMLPGTRATANVRVARSPEANKP